MVDDTQVCFHCGLIIPAQGNVLNLFVQNKSRSFCCYGCHAVCDTIIQAGLEDYYQHRSQLASSQSTDVTSMPDEVALALYDRQDIKDEFVIQKNELEEACLLLENIHCSACVWLNEHHLRKLKGIDTVQIDAATHRALVRWNPALISLSKILKAIHDIGYKAHPYDPLKHQVQLEDQKQKSSERLIFAGVLGMFVMNFSLATYFMGVNETSESMQGWELGGRWSSLVACLFLLAYSGRTFFIGAWRAVQLKQVNMDVPIVLGLSAAFLGSAWATFYQQGDVYFEAIAMFVFFVLLSRRWELKGQLFSIRYLSLLNQKKLKTALCINKAGQTKNIAVKDFKVGDMAVVLPGDTVPIDGLLCTGRAELDESLITGESTFQRHIKGDLIRAGSINGHQRIVVRVTQIEAFSTIAGINQLVLRGLENKPDQEQLINRIASWFIVAVLGITAVTLVYWFLKGDREYLSHVIAVLIVTCPCALALAIPVANSIAAGRLLESGILPVNMSALKALAEAEVIVFDKTGTLTATQLTLSDRSYSKDTKKRFSNIVLAALALQSEHPVSKAIVKHFGAPDLILTDFSNHLGLGVQAMYGKKIYRLGSIEFVDADNLISRSMAVTIKNWRKRGDQVVALGEKGFAPLLVLAFSNPLRQGAKGLSKQLLALGFSKTLILSGDHPSSVAAIANTLNIDNFMARQNPNDKLTSIHELQAKEGKVVMVGDGINDAPTLAAADASISLSSASDLAQLHSDFILLRNNLSAISYIRKTARKTQQIIKQNLFWAVAYNLSMVPAAAAGLISPWIAALGMSLSSLIVVANSLRLRTKMQSKASNALQGASSSA